MKWFGRCRAGGKTTQMIEEAAACPGARLVVSSNVRAAQVYKHARAIRKDIAYPLTFQEFIDHDYYGERIEAFIIDNVDSLIQYIAREIRVLTVSFDTSSVVIDIQGAPGVEASFPTEIKGHWREPGDGGEQ